jgi:hypothetical protein
MGQMQRAKRYRKEQVGLAPKSYVTTKHQADLGRRVRRALAFSKFYTKAMQAIVATKPRPDSDAQNGVIFPIDQSQAPDASCFDELINLASGGKVMVVV